jgi:hypothetical protein
MPTRRFVPLITLSSVAALLLTATLAHAAPPALPAEAPASAPEPEFDAPAPTAAPKLDPLAPVVSVPTPKVEDSLTLTGASLWEGLVDSVVELHLRNGKTLSGTVVAQAGDQLAIARSSDGSVVAVPKREIEGVRLQSSAATAAADQALGLEPVEQRPRDDGRKLYVAGVSMLTIGAPLGLAGSVMLSLAPGAAVIWAPTLLPGIGLIVGGSIALKRGNARYRSFRKAWGMPPLSKLQLTPTLDVGRNGGQLGVVMRF